MQIEGIEIVRIEKPIRMPYTTAFGTASAFNSILVRLDSGKFSGWGESAPWGFPGFSAECDYTAFYIAKNFLAKLILGREIGSGKRLQEVFAPVKGNYFAKAAFDLAWWDLYAQMANQPFWKIIGGVKPEVEAGATIGVLKNFDALMARIQQLVAQGFPRIKLKYCPGWDLEMVRAVRATFPRLVMHIDCNSAYTLTDTEMFKKLDRCDLAMVEQPLKNDDLIDHAALQKKICTPICLDESIYSPEKARKAVQIKACRYVNIKHGRVGGITNALAIHDICRDGGIPCWIGAMGESVLGGTFSISLATLINIKYPSDLSGSTKFYEHNLCRPLPESPMPGKYRLSSAVGIGVTPDPQVMAEVIQEKWSASVSAQMA